MTTGRFTIPQATKASALELAAVSVLAEVEPERLAEIAERTEISAIGGSAAHATIGDLAGRCAFVLEGIHDVVASRPSGVSSPVVVETLGPGDWFGNLWTDAPVGLTLAPRGAGRLAFIRSSRLRSLLADWPDLLRSFARDSEQRKTSLATALLRDREKLADTDRVLSRIDSVANLLVQGGVGGRPILERVQRKYRLTSVPELTAECTEIEQAYLQPEEGIDEDRIRRASTGSRVTATRTRRRIVDGKRIEFDERLADRDFERLLARIDGRVIRKTRLAIANSGTAADLTVDIFQGPEPGLIILEASFSDSAAAERFNVPDGIAPLVAEEVTQQSRYSNRQIARSI